VGESKETRGRGSGEVVLVTSKIDLEREGPHCRRFFGQEKQADATRLQSACGSSREF